MRNNVPIFSQQLSDVDSRDATFRADRPLRADIGNALSTIENVAGAVVIDKANQDITDEQASYLKQSEASESLEVARAEAVREFDKADSGNNVDSAVLKDAEAKVRTLTKAIDANRVDPYVALNRIESIKRKAAALAPSFVKNIMALGGTSMSSSAGGGGSAFNAKVSRQIAVQNALDDEALSLGLNPADPTTMSKVMEHRQLKAMAAQVQNRDIIDGPAIEATATSLILFKMDQLSDAAAKLDDADLPDEERDKIINMLGSNSDPEVAYQSAISILTEEMGAAATSKLSNDVKNSFAKTVQGYADRFMQVQSGELPAKVLKGRADLATLANQDRFRNDYPEIARQADIIAATGLGDTLGGEAIQRNLGNRVLQILENEANGNPGSNGSNVPEQKALAVSNKEFRRMVNSGEVKDKATFQAKATSVANTFKASLNVPTSATAKHTALYDEEFASLADTSYWSKLKEGATPETIASIRDSFNAYSVQYVERKLGQDIKKAMGKAVVTRSEGGGGVRGVNVNTPLVRLLTKPDGTIVFTPTLTGDRMSQSYANEMNGTYATRFNNIIKAYANVNGGGDSVIFSNTVRQ